MKNINILAKSKNWIKVETINQGWSKDEKFVVEDMHHQKFLLRVSDASSFERKKEQFYMLKEIQKLGLNAPIPLELGTFDDGRVFFILSWLEGEDAQIIIPKLDEKKQYKLGIEAGQILKKIHSIPVKHQKTWKEIYQNKIPKKIKMAQLAPIKHPHLDVFINYVLDHMHLMDQRPLSIQHGDYHIGNFIIIKDLKLGIIDFDKVDYSDPLDDFKPFVWNVMKAKAFEIGLIDGYFNHQPTQEFFKILAFYASESCIGHLPWAIQFGEEEIKIAFEVADQVYAWYQGFSTVIPTWYDDELKEQYKD